MPISREERPHSALTPPLTKAKVGREMATQTRPPPKGKIMSWGTILIICTRTVNTVRIKIQNWFTKSSVHQFFDSALLKIN